MKKMLIPIAILCVVIELLTLPNGEREIKPTPVSASTATSSEVTDVPEPVYEVPATPLPEIKNASAATEESVGKVTKPTPTSEAVPIPAPTPTSAPTPEPVPVQPTPAPALATASDATQPVQAGDLVYVPGFGWLESQGEGTVIHDDMMYENGNKVGIMD